MVLELSPHGTGRHQKEDLFYRVQVGCDLPYFRAQHWHHVGLLKHGKICKNQVDHRNFLGMMKIHTKKMLPADAGSFKQKEAELSGEYDWKVFVN